MPADPSLLLIRLGASRYDLDRADDEIRDARRDLDRVLSACEWQAMPPAIVAQIKATRDRLARYEDEAEAPETN